MLIGQFILVGLAALAAGAVNALAGGGTLITFPMLTAVGVPAVAANVTNTVALCPGYIGGTLAQIKDLRGQTKRLWFVIPAGVVGGLIGGILLLRTGEKLFTQLVPFLILLASGLLAVQDPGARLVDPAVEPGTVRRRDRKMVVAAGWPGRHLRRLFRRRAQRDHSVGAGIDDGRHAHTPQRSEADHCLQC